MTSKLFSRINLANSLLIVLFVSLIITSCVKSPNPFDSEDIDDLNFTISFEDQDLARNSIGGPVTIDIPSHVIEKLDLAKDKLDRVELFISDDVDTNDFTVLQQISDVDVEDVVTGLNNLGVVPHGTYFTEGDVIILTLSSSSEDRGKGNPLNTKVYADIFDYTGLADTSSKDVVAITSEDINTDISEELAQEFIEKGYVLSNVHFDYDRSALKIKYETQLYNEISEHIAKKDLKVQVSGHADERGTQEYNLALGERRAVAVRRYLISLGISAGDIYTVSFGEELPIEFGSDEISWAKNRRAEISIIVSE